MVLMAVSRISAREFNQDASRAKRAANGGPVIITDRGKPSHVLMTIAEYEQLKGGEMSALQALADPGADFDFDAPRIDSFGLRPADFD